MCCYGLNCVPPKKDKGSYSLRSSESIQQRVMIMTILVVMVVMTVVMVVKTRWW